MRHLAIGDIHGCYSALQTLLGLVGPSADDILITMGDYVNRGPDSKRVLQWLIDFDESGQLRPLKGNHEIMMLDARRDHSRFQRFLKVGGDMTLRSYSNSTDADAFSKIPEHHWEFLTHQLLPYFETANHFFVHANAYPDHELQDQPDFMLYWESLRGAAPHVSGKQMICGHSSQKSGYPLVLEHATCIDTWAHGGGWLTCLCVETSEIWQANQLGETRRFLKDDFLRSA